MSTPCSRPTFGFLVYRKHKGSTIINERRIPENDINEARPVGLRTSHCLAALLDSQRSKSSRTVWQSMVSPARGESPDAHATRTDAATRIAQNQSVAYDLAVTVSTGASQHRAEARPCTLASVPCCDRTPFEGICRAPKRAFQPSECLNGSTPVHITPELGPSAARRPSSKLTAPNVVPAAAGDREEQPPPAWVIPPRYTRADGLDGISDE